jgi:hypothetical protein
MKPLFHHSSSILLFFYAVLLLVVSIINIPTCMCDDGDQYTNCNIAFTCEGSNITNNLKYPFWGENREKYCGGSADSNTELTCEGSVPKITINGVKYRILDWDNTTQKLTVARDDYWNGICAVSDNNKNSTFDKTLFQRDVVSGSASSKLTLLYNCDTNLLPSMFFSTSCDSIKVVYTLSDPASITCTPTLTVEFPTSVTQAAQLANLNNTNQALKSGFDLKWTGDYTVCQRCVSSGGAYVWERWRKFQMFLRKWSSYNFM